MAAAVLEKGAISDLPEFQSVVQIIRCREVYLLLLSFKLVLVELACSCDVV